VPLLAAHFFLRHVALMPETSLLPRLVATAAWIAAIVGVIGVINNVVFEAAAAGTWQKRVPALLRDLLRVLLVAAGAAFVYSWVWGQELSGALAALGVTSIVMGLALQEPLGNLFSGLVLLMERPFEVGEAIEIGGAAGIVTEINWRSVHLVDPKTLQAEIVPNSVLNKEIIRNHSRPRPMRMGIIDVRFSYDDAPNDVRQALIELARDTPGVLEDPAPIAVTDSYGDFAINYKLIYRTSERGRWKVRNLLTTRIWYMARRHGFHIPFPIRVNLDHPQSAPYGKAPVAPAERLERFTRIPRVPGLERESGRTLLQYAVGESVFDEGDSLEGVYLVVSGSVSLQVPGDEGNGEIARVHAGEIFGESGLHGRHPAETRAVALEDTEVVLMAPETVRELFEKSPKLARDTGHSLDVRRKAARSARETLGPK
jgi:small-conductance mechanosensitive channel